MTTWTEAQIDRHLHLWEHRHGPDSPEAGIVRQLRDRLAEADTKVERLTTAYINATTQEIKAMSDQDHTPHPDDKAVDQFAAAMKTKLAKKRADGRGGWEGPTCSQAFLSELLREHVGKGDPVDVGNLAMMLHQRGEAIAALPTTKETPHD